MKRILILTFLAIQFCYTGLTGQNIDLEGSLPTNTKIKKGVLRNGLTYYIYPTDVTKNVASYYIIQNVGSVLENDDQQGLAHFLEHMAFNGTENFKGKGILNTLQKEGAVFGRDINAYTSFDETVYNMDNIPATNELIDTSLLILHDWSNYLLLTDQEIDAERGVIKEEWRTRQSGGMRIFKQSMATKFNHSKYAERMPIGSMEVVEHFKYKALRDFYHDWYRTDLQAIAIVGDIDVDQIEQKIKKLFSKIPAVKNAKERYIVQIPDNKEMLYTLAMDKEVSTSSISFGINHPKSLKDQVVADLKESLQISMVTSMLSTRLNDIKQSPDAPFLSARIGYGKLARAKNQFSINIVPKPGQQSAAFTKVMEEVNRAVKFGFTQTEIDRTITQFSNYYETQISKEEDMSHGRMINIIKQNYLDNETMTNISKEYALVKNMFKNLTKADLHAAIKKLYTANNRMLIVTGVEGKKNLTEEEALSIIKKAENNSNLTAYKDAFSGKTLMSGLTPKKGAIVSETLNSETGATTFSLSNGIQVHYKFVDKNKNDVQFLARSYGGLSLLNDQDLASANMMSNLVQMSGLGDYSSTDLSKVLAGKTATTRVRLSQLTEEISGSSVTKDVETLLQMVYLRFEKPRFDKDAFKVLQGNLTNYLNRKSKDINAKMRDSVTVTLYGKDNPKHRIFDQNVIDAISFDKIERIYTDRFNNAADFEFFIIGDVNKDQLQPLLEKYIASIPTTKVKENWKNNTTPWLSNTIDKDIKLFMEDPKASVKIQYENNVEYSLKNALLAKTLGAMLQLRYTETLREQEGGTYGASSWSNVSKRPVELGTIAVSFDCNPDKAEQLIDIVYGEIHKIAKGDINQEDLNKTLTNLIKERKEAKDYNRYDMRLVTNYVLEGYDMNNPKNFDNIVNSITAKDIENFTKTILKGAKSYEIVFKPKTK